MSAPQAIVVGGGLAGIAAAIAVANAGLDTVHLAPKGPPDRRTSALMLPSVEYLQSAGLVTDPATIGHPLTQIRIIDATSRLIRAPETLFDSREARLAALGLTPDAGQMVMLDGPGPSICFQNIDGRRPDNNRVHFDILASDRPSEVEKLTQAGAEIVRVLPTCTILRDPEGNQFCLLDNRQSIAA